MSLSETELRELSNIAITAAKAAGAYIQSRFNQHYEKSTKSTGHSLASQVVTEVDLQAEKIIIEHLETSIRQYDFGLLTEEAPDDSSRFEKAYFWCIDPMDGTLPFTEGKTGYAVSISLISRSGDPMVGAVYVPDLERSYTAFKGGGLLLNGEPIVHVNREHPALTVYFDRSMTSTKYYDKLLAQLRRWALEEQMEEVRCHVGYGSVRNAIAVIQADYPSCYFKYPKQQSGGSSIWDYGATRLFFEESSLYVANSKGETLTLNTSHTTYMNEQGAVYANTEKLARYIISIKDDLQASE